MFTSIDEEDRERSSKILLWVALASKPLTLQQLASAIGESFPDREIEDTTMRDYVACCGQVLLIDHSSRVNFVHQSVYDFLVGTHSYNDPLLEGFRINLEKGHLSMLETCIAYMEHDFRRHLLDYWNQRLLDKYALLPYASQCWSHHAKQLPNLQNGFFRNTRFFRDLSPVKAMWKSRNGYSGDSDISVACKMGLLTWLRFPVETTVSVGTAKLCIQENIVGCTPLYYAVKHDNFTMVELLKKLSVDVNDIVDVGASTALHTACKKGHLDMVQFLLSRGANVHATDRFGSTAFDHVKWMGDPAASIVDRLLHAGAPCNYVDEGGRTYLHRAVYNGELKLAQCFLKHGVDPNAADIRGDTSLQLACERHESTEEEMLSTLRLLLAYGAEISAVNRKDHMLHIELFDMQPIFAKVLVQLSVNTSAMDRYGVNALHKAVSYTWCNRERSLTYVRLLLEKGADVHALSRPSQTQCEMTALHLAAREAYVPIIELLVAYGCDINASDSRGMTPLHYAAVAGVETVVKFLIEHNADVSAINHEGQTPLHLAAKCENSGALSVLKVLLAHGGDVLTRDYAGQTVLHLCKRPQSSLLLIHHDADIHALDHEG